MTIEGNAPGGAVVTYSVSASDVVDPHPTVVCSPASGASFPLAATTVSCTASDAAGNLATGSFKVTVQDTTAPSLSGVPGTITVAATGPGGAPVPYSLPGATDLVDPAPHSVLYPAVRQPLPRR